MLYDFAIKALVVLYFSFLGPCDFYIVKVAYVRYLFWTHLMKSNVSLTDLMCQFFRQGYANKLINVCNLVKPILPDRIFHLAKCF